MRTRFVAQFYWKFIVTQDDDDDDDDEEVGKQKMHDSAVDITEKFVLARMTPSLATEMVMKSMFRLPAEIPAHFNSTYTPIAAAGTGRSHLVLAATTLNNFGCCIISHFT